MKHLMWLKINGISLLESEIKKILKETGLEYVKYVCEKDKIRHYLGLFLAKEALKKNGIYQMKRIVKNSFGKPYFDDLKGVYFNISHSENLVVCVLSDMEIGIDVEKIRKFPSEIIEVIYTDNEKKYINASSDIDKTSFLIWTRKESYLKYVGVGITYIDKMFEAVKDDKLIEMFNECTFEQIQLCNDYVVTICTNNSCDDLIIERYYYDREKI